MKILKINSLNGPNYWSNYRKKLIVVKIDLEEFEYLPTNKLAGFSENLKKLLPTLSTHRCSPGVEGGLLLRMEEGTWLGHVVEHVALELQCLAGMECGFGRTYSADKEGTYHVIFAYLNKKAGYYAAKAAVRLVKALAQNQLYETLEKDIEMLRSYHTPLGPSTRALVHEAKQRNIPVTIDDTYSLITLGQGINQKKIWATVTSNTSSIAVDIAADKELTKKLLAANYIPVPQGSIVTNLVQLDKVADELGFPLAIKPLNGNHGRGVATNITSKEKMLVGYNTARKISEQVIVERFISGNDYRILVVDYKFVAVAERTPARVIGTGIHTIQELIDKVNEDSKRGKGHENSLTKIIIDATTENILQENYLSLSDTLPYGQILYLKNTANISTGGTAKDVSNEIHPKNILLAERIAELIGLDICGIDLIAKDISKPINSRNGAVLEVNAGPGLRMHLEPSEGQPRNVAKPIINMLYPLGKPSSIPIIGVTGTNGKTTVVRLLANMFKQAGQFVGYTTTEGIYLNGNLIDKGDCSGPQSAQTILRNPQVSFAVLECARGGIIRSGLGFDNCDISIITNITNDHLSLNDINSLEDMAQVKGVLARSTKKEGYALLNAEDDLVYKLKYELSCKVALFSRIKNERIVTHCNSGGLAIYLENNLLIIQDGKSFYNMGDIRHIPLTFNGTASAMIQNILPVYLVGYIQKLSTTFIKNFFNQFYPSPDTLPGRMNIFNFPHCTLMIDYAHNEAAFRELKNYLKTIKSSKKIGIVGVAGDRRAADIKKMGLLAADIFDEIIIRHDEDGRGRSNEELSDLLISGIKQSLHPPLVSIISNEVEALKHAMEQNVSNTFIFYSVDKVFEAIKHVTKLHSNSHLLQSKMPV